MYKIYADDELIYDDTSSDSYLKVISPKLSLEEGSAGSLKFAIPPGNAGYDSIVRMVTKIRVEKDGAEFWAGRVIQEDMDFWNKRQLICEGELAYLNDTIQPPHHYEYSSDYGVQMYFSALLGVHNANMPVDMQFTLGVVDVSGGISTDTNYENTLECMKKIIDSLGGYLAIRKVGGIRYLDYLEEELNTTTQNIEFGKNLMDFTKSFDSTELATVIIPLGVKLEESEIEGVDSYLTVKGVRPGDPNPQNYSSPEDEIYVANINAVNNFGWIEKVVHWDQVNEASYLMNRAQMYLEDSQFETMVLELSALDLHYLNPDIADINVGEKVYVVSVPHGLNRPFAVKKMDIPLDQPQNTIFQLGDEVKVSLTASTNKANAQIMQAIDNAVDEDAILKAAQENATALMNQNLNGFVTIMTEPNNPPDGESHSEAIYISETQPLEKNPAGSVQPYNVQRFWKWGLSGLGYTDDYGQTWKTAITMDGSILGERIAAGSIHGSKITAGSLALTTAAGQEACTISLSTIGLPGDALELGDLDQNDGTHVASDRLARTVIKYRIQSGTKVSAGNYYFSLYRYSNNTTNVSGFESATGFYNSEYTVATTAWYRIVVAKSIPETVIAENDLSPIAMAIHIGDGATVISSADIRINGMVTFSALSDPGKTTVINGDYIKTGTISGERIDAKGITVTRTVGGQTITTFSVSNEEGHKGEVTVNGNVTLSEDSIIHFSQGSDKTIGDIADEPVAKQIANGTYNGNTFIGGRTIYSPDAIISSALIAQAGEASSAKSGSFILRDGEGNDRLRIQYNSDLDSAPRVGFYSNAGVYYFDRKAELNGGFSDASNASSDLYGSLTVRDGASIILNPGNSGLGGKLVLGYGTTYVSSYENLPSNPVQGQICFVLS